jgi:hypothetical protein
VHDLHTAPVDDLGGTERWQHHPAVAALKWRLEEAFVAELEAGEQPAPRSSDPAAAMRALAASDLVPPVYEWLAEAADFDELVDYLTLEGGPDGGFDDLVALCQVGLTGEPKLEMARNYWDEMGNGTLAAVHTQLHHDLGQALGMRALPRDRQPVEALARTALGGVLATNRRFQPEMVGALGLIELQAGPRCRKVVKALRRLDAPEAAFPFYEEHAVVDPRHGKDWLDNVIAPLSGEARWDEGMVRGARWRSLVNARFFAAMEARFVSEAGAVRAGAAA